MAINYKKIWNGVTVVPKTTTASSLQGELESLTSDSKLYYHNGTTNSPIVTEAHSATLTNKSIDATTNTISNIANTNISSSAAITRSKLAAGTINTALINDGSGNIASSAVTSTELGYVSGVTSAIQTQISGKQASGNYITALTGDVTASGPGSVAATIATGAVTDSKVASGAAIARTKLASGTNNALQSNNGSGVLSDVTDITTGTNNLTLANTKHLELQDATDSTTTGSNASLAAIVASTYRLTNASLVSLANIPVGANGQVLTIVNRVGNPIGVVDDSSASGTASNRIYTGTSASITLSNNASLILKYDSTSARWQVIGGTGAGSSSSINYITNGTAETGTTGWATYADVAGVIPVSGTGGSPSVTLATSSSSPLRGTQSFLFTKDAANRQGQGASYNFTVDSVDRASVLRVSMDYEVSTNYADSVSGNIVTSDMQVFVYDVTNSQLIYCGTQNIAATTTEGHLITTFQTNSNSTSYRLIYHVATTNATSYTLKFDNVILGPQTLIKGTASSDWQSYTPTFTGFGTTSGVIAKYRRVGSNMEIDMFLVTGTMTGVTASITLPNGLTASTDILGAGNRFFAGTAAYGAIAALSVTVLATGGANTITFGVQSSTSAGYNSALGTSVSANASNFSFQTSIPIQGWASNIQLSEDSGNRLIAASYLGNAGTAFTAGTTDLPFTTAVYDYTASWNGSQFTAPETGIYDFAGSVATTTNVFQTFSIYVGGAQLRTAGEAQTSNNTHCFSGSIFLTKGQVASIRATQTSATLNNNLITHWISISKRSSPQTLAGSESVNARYINTAGTSIPNSGTNVFTLATKDYDSHGSFSGTTYTAPISGKYRVTAGVLFANAVYAVPNAVFMRITKNGSDHTYGPFNEAQTTTALDMSAFVMGTVNCLAGDTIQVIVANGRAAGATSLSTTAGTCHLEIERIGN